jgi:transposase
MKQSKKPPPLTAAENRLLIYLVKKSEDASKSAMEHSSDGPMTGSSHLSVSMAEQASASIRRQILATSSQASTTCQHQKETKQEKRSATLASPVQSRKRIYKDKSNSCNSNTPVTKSLKTSVQASTGSGQASLGFWTESCVAMSKRLWFPTEIASADSPTILSDTSSPTQVASSWFTTRQFHKAEVKLENCPLLRVNSETTSSPLSLYSSRAITDAVRQHIDEKEKKELQEKEMKQKKVKERERKRREAKNLPPLKPKKEKERKPTKCMKYRIHPNKMQTQTFLLWMDATRFVYNKVTEQLNKEQGKKVKSQERKKILREWGETSKKDWNDAKKTPPRFRSVPYEIRDSPIRDIAAACAALRSKESCLKRKFQRKKDNVNSLTLRKRQLNCDTNKGKVWPSLFGTTHNRTIMRTEKGKSLPLKFSCDCKLVYERKTKFFYLCVPVVIQQNSTNTSVADPETQGVNNTMNCQDYEVSRKEGRIVIIDPGVRTFATCYDPEGFVADWCGGKEHLRLMWRLERKAARIKKRAYTLDKKLKNRCRIEKRMMAVVARLHKRSVDLITEMHRKLARWLCINYSVILLPKFNVQSIVRKRDPDTNKWKRKIGKKTAKSLYKLAHYRFRTFLQCKAKEMGTKLVLCDEQYTSKTCGKCGKLNETLGSAKTFRCPSCGYSADRDHSAARNILLRYLTFNNIHIETIL